MNPIKEFFNRYSEGDVIKVLNHDATIEFDDIVKIELGFFCNDLFVNCRLVYDEDKNKWAETTNIRIPSETLQQSKKLINMDNNVKGIIYNSQYYNREDINNE